MRASVVVIHNSSILTFKGVDPTSGVEYFFLPGGEIELDETAPQTAVRETFEETGFKIKVDAESALDKDYLFHWNGEDYQCTTIFYRGVLLSPFQSPSPVHDAAYNKGVFWIPVREIKRVFNYNSEILDAVERLALPQDTT